ncbi:tripartite tricarboxylate transporter substrate binding protein [Comamonas thiooxydans]|uniref:Tripartite tricarboxylate transporter substrate binding protein n=1 Tax=Comamonas thiooxydans TaxID=363952 RepID=A0AA42PZR7_9BURK|nr:MULTISPECIES: tripartite tricarboxylate transporter substrate binding protein [Comamonas]EFI61656.1 TctC [Comamonas thiooxydans]MDH1334257.1 tripartite tricarboxylate transporter substrate binding protein [Comamonas thiooxydans]MDH1740218.1 tripartite tricarboxylate transporter substrate binding protein [Comamonas thiooxydans]MDH1786598.1 tripartite tricarboxylate transporter substrate binding protein [Comamonas thiooxydans]TFF57522.1 tripartite tricarboxylate transporter substrate binding 
MKRRSFTQSLISAAAGAALLSGFAATAQAEGLSNRPIRIVVPFGAGGVADVTARVVAQQLSTQLGQPVVIDNKPSAGGIVAADAVAKAAPDGHTLFLMSNGSAVTVNLFNNLPFDMVKDLTPISTLGYFDIGVITDAKSPFKNLGELVSYAKANPGKLNLGSINVGSTQHLAAELFKTTAGIDAQIVPFNGTPAVVTALRGKQIDAAVEILTPIMGQINSKAVNLLAVTGEKRSPLLPNVPTAQESGVKGFVASSWNALAAPSKTPAPVIARLNKEINAAVNNPEVAKKLRELNVQAQASTPEQTAKLLQSEIKRWGDVIAQAKIPKQ